MPTAATPTASRPAASATVHGAAPGRAPLLTPETTAALLDGVESEAGFDALKRALAAFCRFDNFLVYAFARTAPPRLLATSVPVGRLNAGMSDFVAGLFLLDPFVLAAGRGARGLQRLEDIMPEGFRESEFFLAHYRHTNVRDEMRFIVPLDAVRTVHVFVEREAPSPAFAAHDRHTLQALTAVVDRFVQAWTRAADRRRTLASDAPAVAIDLGARIAAMGEGDLTKRECEVVELMLKGHSARSIGQALRIEEGTVTNHKRNIYAKLDIHSMAQLFSLFLKSLQ